MTRNNLADQLRWLLQNTSISKPTAHDSSPKTDGTDSSLARSSRSQPRPQPRLPPTPLSDSLARSQSQSRSQSQQSVPSLYPDISSSLHSATSSSFSASGNNFDLPTREGSGKSNGSAGRLYQTSRLPDDVGSRGGDTMGRLVTSTKPKKPLLISHQAQGQAQGGAQGRALGPGQLPSPSTAGNGASRQRLEQSVASIAPFHEPAKLVRSDSSSSNTIQRPPSPIPTIDPADLAGEDDDDDDDMELMDLTEITTNSAESVQFGEDVTVWTEKAASWDITKAHKRKSVDISKAQAKDDADFLDVYKVLGKAPPPPSPRKAGSSSVSRPRPGRTPASARTRSPGALLDSSSSPSRHTVEKRLQRPVKSGAPEALHPPSTPESRKRAKTTASPASPCVPETALAREKRKKNVQGSEDSLCIPDSDDEFESPPRPNVTPGSHLGLESIRTHLTTQENGLGPRLDRSTAETPRTPTLKSPDTAMRNHHPVSETPIRRPMPRLEGAGADSPASRGAVSQAKQPSMRSSQAPRILAHLSTVPDAIEKQVAQIDQHIQQNEREFLRALSERRPKERRNEIKAEKEKLIWQQKALTALTGSVKTYRMLSNERETLQHQIAQSYANGLDTEDEETRLDELDDQIKLKEDELLNALSDAGLDEAILIPNAQPSRNSGAVVPGTQAGRGAGMVDMSRDSSDWPMAELSATDVVHQTQLPRDPLANNWYDQNAKQQTSRPNAWPSSGFHHTSSVHRSAMNDRLAASGPQALKSTAADEFDVDDEFFAGMDADFGMPFLPQPAKLPTGRGPSPPRSRSQRAEFEFSDPPYHDEELLALAQDYDVQESSVYGGAMTNSRSALRQPSGSAAEHAPKSTAATVKKHVPASQSLTVIPPELMNHRWSSDVQKTLKDRFRMKGFRHNQLEAINATLAGEDAFVLMPTGGGKSLCYQLPAVIKSGATRGVTIVISPLLSLMQDQVDHMKALRIQAFAFNSECSAEYKRQVLTAFDERIPEDFVQLLYITPEMINKNQVFLNAIERLYRKGKFARLVIDEAHCVSQWGHDFRPDYTTIGQVRARFPRVPLMALTATATQNVIVDIKHNLRMANCQVFSQSFNRPNLYYEVRPKSSNNVATQEIANIIKTKYPGVTGIVYTISRKQSEEVAKQLSEAGIMARHYHAGMPPAEKTEVQQAWQKGQVKVVVATIAFGMGIDKSDVRYVIHHALPKSLEGYYQETGRAGRDGDPSDCILFYGKGDIRVMKKLIHDGEGSDEQKERQNSMLSRVTAFCENQSYCRRTEVLRYFGEEFDRSECQKMCDNCRSGLTFEKQDFSEYATAAIKVVQLQSRLTANQCADILVGRKYPDRELENSNQYFGMAKGKLKRHEVVRVIDRLSAEKGFNEDNVVGNHGMAIQYLQIGPVARAFLRGDRRLMLDIQVNQEQAGPSAPKKTKKTSKKAKEPGASNMQSTYVSSPVHSGPKGKQRLTVMNDDDEDDDDDDDDNDGDDDDGHEELYQKTSRHGYRRDGFVVSDEEMEDGDLGHQDDDHGLPPNRPKVPSKSRAKPIARAQATPSRPQIQDLSGLHQDLIGAFVREARGVEESIRNKLELRKPLFTDANFQEMALNWTTTLESMRQLPGIDVGKVREHGPRLLPILKRHYESFKEIMGGEDDHSATRDRADEDVVDLISSDVDEDAALASHYFDDAPAPARASRDVQAFNDRLSGLGGEAGSRGRPRSSSHGKGFKRGMSNGRKWAKRANSGVSKRKAGGSGRRPSGSHAAGGAGSSSKTSAKKSTGMIGMMPL